MKQDPDKKVDKKEASVRLSFDALSAAYNKSYDSQKPTLIKEIDSILDKYLSITEMNDTTILIETAVEPEDDDDNP